MNKIIILTIAYLLSACALTPEQKAEHAAAQKRYEQNLQISLAEQCDKETARLMREQLEQYPYDNEQTTPCSNHVTKWHGKIISLNNIYAKFVIVTIMMNGVFIAPLSLHLGGGNLTKGKYNEIIYL